MGVGRGGDTPLVALLNELDVSAPYGKIGYGYTVTEDAIDLAKGYASRVLASSNSVFAAIQPEALGGRGYSPRRRRPLARRLRNTLRPPGVRLRTRKP